MKMSIYMSQEESAKRHQVFMIWTVKQVLKRASVF